MGLSAGDLNTPITLWERHLEQDEYGQRLERWAQVGKSWADVRFLSGLETIKQSIEVAEVRLSVRIRYRRDVHPAMRVRIGDNWYEIEAVLPDLKRKAFLDLSCKGLSYAGEG